MSDLYYVLWSGNYSFLFILIPTVVFAIWAQIHVKSTFNKYSQVANSRGLTGAEAAANVLKAHGVYDVRIDRISGSLTDNYSPSENVIHLSESVYASTSVAAIGVACHEAGHAVQYAENYGPIKLRAAIIPVTKIGSNAAVPLIIVGMLLNWTFLCYMGIIFYSASVVFQLITLPVEFDASGRALRAIKEQNLLSKEEQKYARKTLGAAAMTYVAALASALVSLLRLLLIVRGNSGRRR